MTCVETWFYSSSISALRIIVIIGFLLPEIPSSRLSNGLYLDSRADHRSITMTWIVFLFSNNPSLGISIFQKFYRNAVCSFGLIVIIITSSSRNCFNSPCVYSNIYTRAYFVKPRGTDPPPCAKKFFHGDRYGSSWRTEIGAVPVTPMDYKHFHRTIPRKSLDCPICFQFYSIDLVLDISARREFFFPFSA